MRNAFLLRRLVVEMQLVVVISLAGKSQIIFPLSLKNCTCPAGARSRTMGLPGQCSRKTRCRLGD